jgi:hypothetical protein
MKKIWLMTIILIFSSFVFSQEARKIDEFGIISCQEIKKRVAKIHEELNKNSESNIIVFYYVGQYYPQLQSSKKLKNRLARKGEAEERAKHFQDMLANIRGEPLRIVMTMQLKFGKFFPILKFPNQNQLSNLKISNLAKVKCREKKLIS